jgi:hypothetical protein
MPISFQHAYEYVQQNFYNKSFAQKTEEKRQKTGKVDPKASKEHTISCVHGIQHAKAVADLIEVADREYRKYCDTYALAFAKIAAEFNIQNKLELLNLVKIAALFHDCGRLADGVDFWDEDSANHCLTYLQNQGIELTLATLIANTIRYKDLPKEFMSHNPVSDAIKLHSDFIRQLLNMGDTIEVMRTREIFGMRYLSIIPFLNNHQEVFINEVLKPHYQRLRIEKRASYTTKFELYHPPLDPSPPSSQAQNDRPPKNTPRSEIYRQQLLTLKKEYEERKDSRPYLSIWGPFFGFSARIKLNAVNAILEDPLIASRPAASLQGRLKKAADLYIAAYQSEHPVQTTPPNDFITTGGAACGSILR